MMTDAEVSGIRRQFPVLRDRIYVATCSQGALCDAVAAGVQAHTDHWNRVGLGWDLWIEKYESIRVQFAKFIGAKPEEVAVTTSASAGINVIAGAMDFTPRKKVVMGEFEFPTMGHIWLAQEKRGAKVHFLRAKNGTIPVEDYARAVDDETCIVPVTGVSFMNGIRSDVKALTELAHSRGALVMVDDYQDCGTRPVNVKEMGVDFYVTGALKYLLASAGLGFLYVREDLIEKLVPIQSSWIAQRDAFAYQVDRFDLAPTARRFEIGTPPIPNLYAAAAAMEYLTGVGLDRIRDHVAGLSRMFMEGVRELGIEMKTSPDSVGPLVVLKTKDVGAVLAKMEQHGITASSRFDGLRISFHLYNNQQDVRAVLDVLESNRDLMVTSDQHAIVPSR